MSYLILLSTENLPCFIPISITLDEHKMAISVAELQDCASSRQWSSASYTATTKAWQCWPSAAKRHTRLLQFEVLGCRGRMHPKCHVLDLKSVATSALKSL